jgi:hypothetical protein
MRRINNDALLVLAGLALLLAFSLGLIIGVKVEAGARRLAESRAAVEVMR